MLYSGRFRQILTLLLQADGKYIPVSDLADKLKVSRRTLFRELENSDSLLRPYHLVIASRARSGLRLEGDPADLARLQADLQDEVSPVLNREERQNLLAYELLRLQEVRKLIYYAGRLQVSEATISNDLERIQPFLAQYDIELVRTRGKIEIVCTEGNRRRAMSALVQSRVFDGNEFTSFSPELIEREILRSQPKGVLEMIRPDILHELLQLFWNNHTEFGLDHYTQTSYIGLLLHLAIAIERIERGEAIATQSEVQLQMENSPEYLQARRIGEKVAAAFGITMPEAELTFIAMHLQGAKSSLTRRLENQELDILIQRFIQACPPATAAILEHDETFRDGFATHLQPTLLRLRYHMRIYNPLLDYVKTTYASLYQDVLKAQQVIAEAAGEEIPEEETAFITIHVGAALERAKSLSRHRQVSAGVVCASGIGVSALMAARLQYRFGRRLQLTTLSMEEVRQHPDKYEMLISTFSLPELPVPVVPTSPLLPDEDLDRIDALLQTLEAAPAPIAALPDSLDKMQNMAAGSAAAVDLAQSLCLKTAPAGSTFEALIELADAIAGGDGAIAEALRKREALGSVRAPEYGFGLLHCQSPAAEKGQVFFLYPEEEPFSDPELAPFRTILVLLLPEKAAAAQRRLLSLVTTSLMDDNRLREAVFKRDINAIRDRLAAIWMEELARENKT